MERVLWGWRLMAGVRTSLNFVVNACVGLFLVMASSGQIRANDVLEGTILAGVEVSGNSDFVSSVANQNFELSDGTPMSLEQWYSGGTPDLRATFLTPVNADFGILWGLGTGERGPKYDIEPSLKLGFIQRVNLGESAALTFQMSVVVGGFLNERKCTADYGPIGGIQDVNCRMSASLLPPEETLNYLFRERPHDQVEAAVTYRFMF